MSPILVEKCSLSRELNYLQLICPLVATKITLDFYVLFLSAYHVLVLMRIKRTKLNYPEMFFPFRIKAKITPLLACRTISETELNKHLAFILAEEEHTFTFA